MINGQLSDCIIYRVLWHMYPSRLGFRTQLYEITSCSAELLIPHGMNT